MLKQWYKYGNTDDMYTVFIKFMSFGYNDYMWFFVPLIILYLSMPFLAVFVFNADKKMLRTFLLISLMLGCISPLQADFSPRSSMSDIYIFGTRFISFAVAGYYLGNYEISRKTRHKLHTASLACIPIMILGTAWLQFNVPEHYKYFIQYTNIPCSIISYSIFVLFRFADWDRILRKLRVRANHLAAFSSLSLGIYLIQKIGFMAVGKIHGLDGLMIPTFIIMYIGCILSVGLIKRIPLLKKTV